MATAPLVIFDLDGTLVDTGPDLVDSLNHTIGTVGLAPVVLEDLNHLVGQGARVMIARAFAMQKVETTPEQGDHLFAVFLEHYSANMPGHSRPFPGLVEAMDRLEAEGFALAVCTNKSETMSLRLLQTLGLSERFKAIVGGDSLPHRKPDPRHILGTIERAGGDPATSVMIGDSINDIAAARDAGVASIGVPFGYTDVPITELKPDRVIEHFDALTPALVHDLIRAARAA
ncbi:phosphoglycolate phosphatase [Rhizobium sp. EC-SD404]|uniref:phosphoglycolate phosphatase n=1 Tax=Rhizobium sp. EC-SD404 TaxID=2038389 RepID=UPI0012526BA1|nr:phosphoglycolate phosphatase [Rhizobium sp. EC-SD404]VVT19721.1 Phosphoglycolate phosphatase [Rhizobium sp. EC-SD404]